MTINTFSDLFLQKITPEPCTPPLIQQTTCDNLPGQAKIMLRMKILNTRIAEKDIAEEIQFFLPSVKSFDCSEEEINLRVLATNQIGETNPPAL